MAGVVRRKRSAGSEAEVGVSSTASTGAVRSTISSAFARSSALSALAGYTRCTAPSTCTNSSTPSTFSGADMCRQPSQMATRGMATKEHFPMECISVRDFMKLELMTTRSKLLAQVVRPPPGAAVHFVSHQWLGDRHPDPEGMQLWSMQAVFQEAIAGRAKRLFSSRDWEAFSEGWSRSSGAALKAAEAKGLGRGRLTPEDFQKDVLDGYVWLDFCSVPQLTDRKDSFKASDALREQLQDNLAAVRSIPHYVERCDYFWILAPRARHADSGELCDLTTCRGRGWCRLEEWANFLCMRQKMPLIVSRAPDAQEGPRVQTLGLIDYAMSQLGRPDKAPCRGGFTCCRLGHEVKLDDGTVASIPCDKDRILPVLQQLLQAKLDFFGETGQKLMFNLMSTIGLTGYAGSAFDAAERRRLDPEESLEHFLRRIHFEGLDDEDEAGSSAMHHAMGLAHPEVVRRIADARPELVSKGTKAGFTPLMAGVHRSDGLLADIMSDPRFCHEQDIRAATLNGVTALDHAAKNGFAAHAQLLLELRADVDPRRKDNGYTPLLSASEAGYDECVALLLARRADPRARGLAGETAMHLAANPTTLIGNNAHSGKATVTKLLLMSQADTTAGDKAGKTALELASECGYEACSAWLTGRKVSL